MLKERDLHRAFFPSAAPVKTAHTCDANGHIDKPLVCENTPRDAIHRMIDASHQAVLTV